MTAYVLGAGASASCGYPLASKLLQGLSDFLDGEASSAWVGQSRNRILQVRETFGSLDDFENILGKLEEHGNKRIKPMSPTTYRQDPKDIFHDCSEELTSADCETPDVPAEGFYPQYLRSDLITALREWFYRTEQNRSGPTAYDSFAQQKVNSDATVITLNYDVALERALARAGKWDVGNGYGFTFLSDRQDSPTVIYKLHGSVNWFQTPMQENPPPLMFSRDLKLLGYNDLVDPRIGETEAVNNTDTLILPNPTKHFFWESFWLPLWSATAERLRWADEVFIHGYSMPAADLKARDLLFDNILKTAAINVYCRSTSDRIAEEFHIRGFTNVKPFPATEFGTWATTSAVVQG